MYMCMCIYIYMYVYIYIYIPSGVGSLRDAPKLVECK